jgi:hypothetical protein
MIESLRRHWIPIVLFSLVPISSCTLISEVDRGLIDDGPPDASGGAGGTGASGGSSGTDGTGGTSGTGGTNDAPTSNDDATDDDAEDAMDDSSGD